MFSRRDLLRLTAVAGGTALLNGPSFARTVFAAPASQATPADTKQRGPAWPLPLD